MRWRRVLRALYKSPVMRTTFLVISLIYFVHQFTLISNSNGEMLPVEVPAMGPTPRLQNQIRKEDHGIDVDVGESVGTSSSTGRITDWIEAEPEGKALYLYSAYIDKRKAAAPAVRLIAIIKKKTKLVDCTYWYASNKKETKSGHFILIKENWGLPYSAGFVVCPLPYYDPEDPLTRVGATTVRGTAALLAHSLHVEDMDTRGKLGEMNVCIKPLHYEFNRALWLVEFIEMYKLLGADHFIFYNHTVGPDVEVVLRHYMKQGNVEVLPWSLPVTSKKDIRTEGIFASLNDCNLRSVRHFPLAAMVDVDEFIIPRKEETLLETVRRLGPNYSSYVFQNVFFYLYWENDTALHSYLNTEEDLQGHLFGAGSHMPYLLTQTKTRRLDAPHKHSVRSKYLARPEKVIEVGNHVVWNFAGARSSLNVPASEGLTQHYRICEYGGFDCLKQPNHIDQTAQKYMSELLNAVAAECSSMFPAQPSCPAAPPLGSPW